MIANIRNSQARKLCTLAAGDESVLQFPLPDYIFGFHTQQSCEKLMKALIASHNQLYPFTHNLVDLAQQLEQCGEMLVPVPSAWNEVQKYGVWLRYDYGPQLDEHERNAFRETVEKLREHVIPRILELEQASKP